jgi:hypothetical protein
MNQKKCNRNCRSGDKDLSGAVFQPQVKDHHPGQKVNTGEQEQVSLQITVSGPGIFMFFRPASQYLHPGIHGRTSINVIYVKITIIAG